MAHIPGLDLNTTLHPYYLAFSGASVLASAFVVVSYIKLRKRIQHPSGVQLWRSIFDILFAGSIIALFFINAETNDLYCDILGPIFQFSLLGSQCWYFVLSFDLLFSLFNPFSDLGSNVKFYHFFVWVVSGASVVVIFLYGDFDYRPAFQLCWIRASEDTIDTPNILSWATLFAPTIAFLIFGIIVTIIAWARIRNGINETLKLRERVLWNCTVTNFVFTINWAAAGVLYIILYTQESGNEAESPRLFGAFAAIVGGLGLTDAIVWILTQGLPCEMCRAEKKIEELKPVNYALRREIIYNTAQGICDNLDRILEYGLLNKPPERKSKYYPTDIRPSKNSHATYTFKVRNAIGEKIPFHDYAPRVFRLIRHMIGITDNAYQQSFKSTLEGTEKMKERFTEGKSGSFFYFTPDGKYLVKTMTVGEVKTLLNMLPDYAQHLYNHRNSLLCKYVGLHYVKMYGEEVYFVVMQSVFVTDLTVHERYDIKGSTHGRYSKNLHLDKTGYIKEVLKDLDIHKRFMISEGKKSLLTAQMDLDIQFLTRQNIMDYSMLVGVRYVRQYRSVPGADTPMAVAGDRHGSDDSIPGMSGRSSINGTLELKQGDHDLGQPLLQEPIHRSRPTIERILSPPNPEERKVEIFQRHNGGVKAEVIDGPGVYYFGIIDILQYYNLRKKLEHFFKSYIICQPSKKISCVNPRFYGERFREKIIDITQTHTGELSDDIELETPIAYKKSSDVPMHIVGSAETSDV